MTSARAILRGKRLLGIDALRWNAVAPWRAARVTASIILPLLIGWICGHIDYGAYAALGALPAAPASFLGETVSRVALVVAASVGMAVSTFVGGTIAATAPWLLVPTIALWGYAAGLAVCLGPRVSAVVLTWSIALLISVGLPFGPSEAVLRSALVLAGGLLQALLAAGAWALRPGSRERMALADSYASLARYSTELAQGKPASPAPTAFPADAALQDPNPLLPLGVRLTYIDLLEHAERVRACLAALAAHALEGGASATEPAQRLAAEAAAALNLIAGALAAGGSVRPSDLNERVAALAVPTDAEWRWVGETLVGELRTVAGIVANPEAAFRRSGPQAGASPSSSGREPSAFATAFALLRANISTVSEAGRHALRLAAVAAFAEALAQAVGLYQGRWVALTILFVLKPDYRSTFNRGVQAAVGTSLGVLLGALAGYWAHGSQATLVAAAAISTAAAYVLFDVSFLLFILFLTAFIVVLLALLGVPAISTAEARFLATLIGSSLALVAYFAWPTWEGDTTQEKFARLLDSHREYVEALLRELAHPGSCGAAQLRALQGAARRARSDAEAASARLFQEPHHPPLTPEVARALIAAVARLARAALALHVLALSPHRSAQQAVQAADVSTRLDDLRASIASALDRLAVALRGLQAPPPIPALRPLHAALQAANPPPDAALVGITDLLADAVNKVDAIERAHLPPVQG